MGLNQAGATTAAAAHGEREGATDVPGRGNPKKESAEAVRKWLSADAGYTAGLQYNGNRRSFLCRIERK